MKVFESPKNLLVLLLFLLTGNGSFGQLPAADKLERWGLNGNTDSILIALSNKKPQELSFLQNYWFAFALADHKEFKQARNYIGQSVSQNPYYSPAYFLFGQIWLLESNTEAAYPYLRAAIILEPDIALYYATMGALYDQMMQWDSAMKYYSMALQRPQPSGSAYVKATALATQLGKPDSALVYCYRCLNDPFISDATYNICLYNTGLLQLRQGAYEDAIIALQTLLRNQPEDYEVMEMLIQAYFGNGEEHDETVGRVRKTLFDAAADHSLLPDMNKRYKFVTFENGPYSISGYEYFHQPEDSVYARFAWDVADTTGSVLFTIQGMYNDIVTGRFRDYYLRKVDDTTISEFYSEQFATATSWPYVKKTLIQVIEGKKTPDRVYKAGEAIPPRED